MLLIDFSKTSDWQTIGIGSICPYIVDAAPPYKYHTTISISFHNQYVSNIWMNITIFYVLHTVIIMVAISKSMMENHISICTAFFTASNLVEAMLSLNV